MRLIAAIALLLASQSLASESLSGDAARGAVVSKLRSGVSVAVVRVENKPGPDRSQGVGGYRILSHPTELSSQQVDQLATLFAQGELFRPHHPASACGFFPGFALRLGAEGSVGSVLLCFDCNEMQIIGLGDLGYESTCHVRAQLLQLLREVLPTDPDLRRLDLEEECYF